jgi:hypothetical protein
LSDHLYIAVVPPVKLKQSKNCHIYIQGEANAGVEAENKPTVSSQSENGEKAAKEDKTEPTLVKDKSGDVKPASDVVSEANTARTPQNANSSVAEKMVEPIQADSKMETTTKEEANDAKENTKNLFKMWSKKSTEGLDSSSTHSTSGKPAPGVPRKAWSSKTALKAEEEESPAAPGVNPPKPGSLDVVNGLEVRNFSNLRVRFQRYSVFNQFFDLIGTSG